MRSVLAGAVATACVALSCLAASAQSGPSITVFAQPNFAGASRTFSGPERNLERLGMNDQIQSVIVRSGSWRLCDQGDFGPPCVTLNAGSYRSLDNWGLSRKISSFAPVAWNNGGSGWDNGNGGGWNGGNSGWNGGSNNGWVGPGGQGDVILFEDDNFRGDARSVSAAVRNLSSLGFNDKASSVVINRGRWILCDQGDYGGPCIVLTPGRYARLSDRGMNDKITSLRPY